MRLYHANEKLTKHRTFFIPKIVKISKQWLTLFLLEGSLVDVYQMFQVETFFSVASEPFPDTYINLS